MPKARRENAASAHLQEAKYIGRLALSLERKALILVVVGSSPTMGLPVQSLEMIHAPSHNLEPMIISLHHQQWQRAMTFLPQGHRHLWDSNPRGKTPSA